MYKPSLSCFFAIAACTLLSFTAGAQHKEELKTISRQMYADGDISFILVDAYNDGLLDEGEAYQLVYSDGDITLNKEALPKPFARLYAERLKAFDAASGKGATNRVLTGEGLKLNKILDPNSDFRMAYARQISGNAQSMRNDKALARIVMAMAGDKLIDTVAGYYFVYNKSGIQVNNLKLSGQLDNKYRDMFLKEVGFVPVKENDAISAHAEKK